MNSFCVENTTVRALRMEMKIPRNSTWGTGEISHMVWDFCALTSLAGPKKSQVATYVSCVRAGPGLSASFFDHSCIFAPDPLDVQHLKNLANLFDFRAAAMAPLSA